MIRYEGGINNGIMKILVMVWYLYALVATASYAGEIRSFFINPGKTAPLGISEIRNKQIFDHHFSVPR